MRRYLNFTVGEVAEIMMIWNTTINHDLVYITGVWAEIVSPWCILVWGGCLSMDAEMEINNWVLLLLQLCR